LPEPTRSQDVATGRVAALPAAFQQSFHHAVTSFQLVEGNELVWLVALIHGSRSANDNWNAEALREEASLSSEINLQEVLGCDEAADETHHLCVRRRGQARIVVKNVDADVGLLEGVAAASHDRGGRVGYRLTLDHPGRVAQLAVLDIITTWDMWRRIDARLASRAWHWTFLALPEPFPETLIGHDPKFFFDSRARAGAKAKDASIFDPRALAHYHTAYEDPARIHAMCEDYRAGRSTDLADDEADRTAGNKIACPVLALWGTSGLPGNAGIDPLACWRDWASDLRGFPIESGHYVPEENPDATARALLEFFGAS